MHLVVLPAENDAEATLHGLEETADHAWEHCSDDHTQPDSPKVELGGVITPDKHKCYNLHFDSDVWQSLFKVRVRVSVRVRVRVRLSVSVSVSVSVRVSVSLSVRARP